MNIRILLLVSVLSVSAALALSCGPGGKDERMLAALAEGYASGGEEGPGFEALSASTNHAGADTVPSVAPEPLSGAAFVQQPQIGNYGTVALAYPVEVPAGRAGMQPAVALSYSSSGGDGIAGIGWVLSAGPGAISRDTTRGELKYDYSDTFMFNGKRLVKVSGPAESEDGTYRLEIESGFSRFELSGSAGGGVWRVLDTNGVVTLYGEDASGRVARPDDSTRVYLWSFSRSTDRNGNFMTASYRREGNMPYLEEIRYTGNENAGLPARQWVRFSYKKREDAYVSKAAGFPMRMDRLLDAVRVGWDDPARGERELWRYECVYRVSEDSGRPLLRTVRSTRHSTAPEFFYEEADHYFLWRGADNPYAGEASDRTRCFEGDFNGDGLSDMVFFDPVTGDWKAAEAVPGGGYVSRIYGNRFRGEELSWLPGGVTGDYNGDGRSDIAFYLPRTREMWTAEHNGRTFDFHRYGSTGLSLDLFACEWFAGDFDGNGLSDAVLFHEPTGRWVFMRNGGGYFDFLPIGRNFRNLFRDDYNPDAYLNGGGTSDTSARGLDRERVRFFSGDFNGDGRTDISVYDARSGKWWVGESGRSAGEPGFRFLWIRYASFDAPAQALFAHDRFSGDFNGDGLTDVLLLDREEGRWWLGTTGDRSISFSVYSDAPQFGEITRWLQGDFNGDGRTDIGFYSSTDGKFWIGEGSASGFRYRAYTNLRACPDPERILAAPLPADEVVVSEARAVVPGPAGAAAVRYEFDGNAHRGRGEQAWAGRFTGAAGTELLVYRRAEGVFYLKNQAGISPVLACPLFGAEGGRVLEGGRPRPYRGGDGLLYYRPEEGLFGGKRHVFSLVRYDGTKFADEPVADFGGDEVGSFDIGASRYWMDRFEPGDTDNYLLVLDDRRDTPGFVLFGRGGAARRVSIAAGALDAAYLGGIRNKNVRIMSGMFGDGRAGLLLVDFSAAVHCWYFGFFTRDGSAISFTRLSGNPRFVNEGFGGFRVSGESGARELVYVTAPEQGPVTVRRVRIDGGAVSAAGDLVPGDGVEFRGDFDSGNAPVVYENGTPKRVVMGTSGCRLEPLEAEERIARPDLYERVYPFEWLQGDYNGDGKTDIGFFHTRESQWYFALTQGTVPDLLAGVANGIGGSYAMEYENSSGFDNTGGDGVPDLPVNYRVCVKLTARDGLGRSVVTRYRYRNGCAFSAFVNGVKETDYFGFGEFTAMDAYGAAVVSRYHAMPYEDYLRNRALAGAVRETVRKGSDGMEYARTEYDYEVKEVGAQDRPTSYFPVATEVRSFMAGVLTETRTCSVELAPGRYELISKSESATDHYEDRAHAAATVKTFFGYESFAGTNETRLAVKRSFDGSARETTTAYGYDQRGNLARERTSYTGAGLAPAADRVIEYGYDDCGNVVMEKDASGSPERVVEKEYDAALRQFVVRETAKGDRLDLATSYLSLIHISEPTRQR
ncbi:MAG: SpvB/TcaC N-terminal domain-containing protein, partial [bacterium]|nr:SpvB/TcaC N-terminal domain-containing protein [bacterium]